MGSVTNDVNGYVTVLLPFLLCLTAFSTVALLDLLAYVATGATAQTAADTAALAAAAPATTGVSDSATARAQTVVDAYGGILSRCECARWRDVVTVEVQFSVPARALPHLGGARHVVASASATARF